jgi:serine/threonine protein kinase
MTQRYRPLYKLDAGGMAEVFVAEALSVAGYSKRVAIKRILPGLVKDDRFTRMFLDEARISLRLNHANVVSVQELGESDNTYFIVMEFVEGTNLKNILEAQAKRGRPLPVPLTVWILNEVLKGLHYAHQLRDDAGVPLGIVHRDVSPPNILISWNGEVKLTDFGLAKATTQVESTDPGVVKGKYSYLSPEAAHAQEVDHRSDVFAVGILAFEMLTGRRLFKGKNDFQTIALVRAAEVPSIRSFNPEVPAELEAILNKALAKDVNARYQTADDFAHDLLTFLFKKQLMVGSRDMIELLRPLRQERERELAAHQRQAEQERSPNGLNLIIDLIQEEMIHFRSLGEAPMDRTGAVPVVGGPVFPTAPADPSKPIDLEDFSPGSGSLGLSPTPLPPLRDDSNSGASRPSASQSGRGSQSGRRAARSGSGAAPVGPAAKTSPKLAAPLQPPMPTVADAGSGSWLIIVAVLGVLAVVFFFVLR